MNKQMDLTSGNLFKKLWQYAIPLILSGFLQLLYNACDLIVCGNFGSEHSVGAISSTNSIINLVVNLFLGLSVGANVCMSKAYGEKNQEKGQKILHTAMLFSVIIGIIVTIIGISLSSVLLKATDVPEANFNLSYQYLTIYFSGMLFTMIYNFGSAILRACGDSRRPFIFLSIAGVLNICLNLIFVICFNLDVAGVALATIISQAVSATLIVVTLFRNKNFFKFSFKEFKISKTEAKEIIIIGLAAGLQSVLFSISNILIQKSINSLGELVLDGSGSSSSIEGFIYIVMNQTAQAAIAAISANYGAKKYENIKKIIIYSLIISFLSWAFVAGIALIFKNQLIGFYLKNEEAATYATQRLLIIASTYYLCGVMDILAYSLRGIGHSYVPTIVTLIGVCGSRIFWIFVMFPMEQFHNLTSVIVSWPISWAITDVVLIIFLIFFYKKMIKNSKISSIENTIIEE